MGLPTAGKQCETAGMRRVWDSRRGAYVISIRPGDCHVTLCSDYIGTLLGSCVAACVWDPIAGVGGMNHFMLPEDRAGSGQWAGVETLRPSNRFGVFAMESLINCILNHGGQRRHLHAKVFGGGRVLPGLSDVGQRNIRFVRQFLDEEGIAPEGEDLGGPWPRKVLFHPGSGRAFVKRLRKVEMSTIAWREREHLKNIQRQPVQGSVELF